MLATTLMNQSALGSICNLISYDLLKLSFVFVRQVIVSSHVSYIQAGYSCLAAIPLPRFKMSTMH